MKTTNKINLILLASLTLFFSCGKPEDKNLNHESKQVFSQRSEESQISAAPNEQGLKLNIVRNLTAKAAYQKNVAPILERSCTSCHGSATFLDLSSFPFASGNKDQEYILSRIVARTNDVNNPMPPILKSELNLDQKEKSTLQQFGVMIKPLLVNVVGLNESGEPVFSQNQILDFDQTNLDFQIEQSDASSSTRLVVQVLSDEVKIFEQSITLPIEDQVIDIKL